MLEVEEDGIGFRSLEVGNTHTGPSRLARHMIHMHIPSIIGQLRGKKTGCLRNTHFIIYMLLYPLWLCRTNYIVVTPSAAFETAAGLVLYCTHH